MFIVKVVAPRNAINALLRGLSEDNCKTLVANKEGAEEPGMWKMEILLYETQTAPELWGLCCKYLGDRNFSFS